MEIRWCDFKTGWCRIIHQLNYNNFLSYHGGMQFRSDFLILAVFMLHPRRSEFIVRFEYQEQKSKHRQKCCKTARNSFLYETTLWILFWFYCIFVRFYCSKNNIKYGQIYLLDFVNTNINHTDRNYTTGCWN